MYLSSFLMGVLFWSITQSMVIIIQFGGNYLIDGIYHLWPTFVKTIQPAWGKKKKKKTMKNKSWQRNMCSVILGLRMLCNCSWTCTFLNKKIIFFLDFSIALSINNHCPPIFLFYFVDFYSFVEDHFGLEGQFFLVQN